MDNQKELKEGTIALLEEIIRTLKLESTTVESFNIFNGSFGPYSDDTNAAIFIPSGERKLNLSWVQAPD